MVRFIGALTLAGLLASASTAEAAGCIKGAIVGGIAGHYAGHHAILGAMGGCAAGRAMAAHARQRQMQPHVPVNPPPGQTTM